MTVIVGPPLGVTGPPAMELVWETKRSYYMISSCSHLDPFLTACYRLSFAARSCLVYRQLFDCHSLHFLHDACVGNIAVLSFLRGSAIANAPTDPFLFEELFDLSPWCSYFLLGETFF